MASTSETGHAKNVANFEDLISFCNGYGPTFNPTKTAISLTALSTKRSDAVSAMATVNTVLATLTNAINQREIIFAPLPKLVTRVVSAVAASDVSKQIIADVQTIARKLQGRRATPKKKDDPATPQNEAANNISASQLSFDSQVENLDKLVQLLSAQSAYKPNETDLTVDALKELLNNMRAANTDVVNAATPVSNARISRNNVLYHPTDGMLERAKDTKLYVKSVFGASSPQYKQVSKIKFGIPRNLR